MKNLKKAPKFKNEKNERDFWQKNDSTDYVDWSLAKAGLFSSLRPTTKPISIRLPEFLIVQLKTRANKLDMPYQSLIKEYLAGGLKREI